MVARRCALLLTTLLSACPTDAQGGKFGERTGPYFGERTGPYLGEASPGDTPRLFAPGLLAADLHGCPVFSADGREAFWNTMDGQSILWTRCVDGHWRTPQELSCGGRIVRGGEPCLSVDGGRLFFVGPLHEGETIYFADRDEDGWGEAERVSPGIDELGVHWQVSVADNGNLYFHSLKAGGGDLYLARREAGGYAEPERLPPAVNTDQYEHAPFIFPDETRLLFSRVDLRAQGRADLFISVRRQDGSWTRAQPLDPLNREGANETCPNLSRDGRYLFYLANTTAGLSAHWVDAAVLEEIEGGAEGP